MAERNHQHAGRDPAGTPLSLLERLREDPEESAWQRLTAIYLPLIRRWLGQQGLPDSDADDLTQEILLVLVRELPGFEHSGRTGAFRSWLRSITVHRVRGYWRGKRTSPDQAREALLDGLEDPTSELSRQWDREHDREVAARLLDLVEPEFAPATWRAFRRQVCDGASAAETAAELGTSRNAVLIAKSRVLRRLRHEAAGLID